MNSKMLQYSCTSTYRELREINLRSSSASICTGSRHQCVRRAPPERRSRGQVLQVPGMKQLRHIQAQFSAGLQEKTHIVLERHGIKKHKCTRRAQRRPARVAFDATRWRRERMGETSQQEQTGFQRLSTSIIPNTVRYKNIHFETLLYIICFGRIKKHEIHLNKRLHSLCYFLATDSFC